MPHKKIGIFSAEIISTLNLDIPVGTPIYIADSNIAHMKASHPEDYRKYYSDIESIIADPDYVGKIPKMILLNSQKNTFWMEILSK